MMNLIVPKFKEGEAIPVWVERSLREGKFLHEMLRRERARTQERLVRTAQAYRNHQRPRGCEFELMSVMDLRTFIRWQQTDEGIVTDPGEFRKLVNDNPVMTPWKA